MRYNIIFIQSLQHNGLQYIYSKMITTVSLVNITSHSYNLFLLMRTLKIYFLSNFQIYNIVLLTLVTMLCITPPGLICLITGSLYLLTTFTNFSHSPPPTSGNHQSVLCIYKFMFCFVFLNTPPPPQFRFLKNSTYEIIKVFVFDLFHLA